MIRRARLISVLGILIAGAVGVIASTQTWLDVALAAGGAPLHVAGASAIPVLAPLCLAVLALGAALTIVGPVLRYVFGALSVSAAVALLLLSAPMAFDPPVGAVASEVTTATGIAGDAVAGLVATITPTPWPAISLGLWAVLLASGALTLATAHAWRRGGRRYAAEQPAARSDPAAPLDAIDSWDDLSRGDDPTR